MMNASFSVRPRRNASGAPSISWLLRRNERGVLRLADEPLERWLAHRLVALRERAHRAHQLADARDVRGLAADAELGAPRHDLHLELALDAVDVLLVRARHEHHLVGIGDQDGDLRGRTHDPAFSLSVACTMEATCRPSARSFVSATTFGMTLLMSRGPVAPV